MLRMLMFQESQDLLSKLNFPLCNAIYASSPQQLEQVKLFPVVAKIDSDIAHKTDVGCVKINIQNKGELLHAYNEILNNAKKVTQKVYGVVVQPMLTGVEVIVGIKKDATFDHVVVFGLGGVFVELFNDITLRILPVSKKDAISMMSEIKGSKLFDGYRGGKKCSTKSIVNLIMLLNGLIKKHPNIMELDFNPVIVNENQAVIVDSRIIVA